MNDLVWKIKQFLRQIFPIALLCVALYGAHAIIFKKGVFRHGVEPGVTRLVRMIPFFGTRLMPYRGSGKSYAYYSKRKKRYRHARRRHRRR